MKCPDYDPDAYGCLSPCFDKCPAISARQCSCGWTTFWTPAERVGLKAMGKALRGMMNLCPKNDSNRMIIWGEAVAIRAYVKAARKFKED